MLSLNLTSKIKLTDDDSLNGSSSGQVVVGTCFDDPNSVVETIFEEYVSGRKTDLNVGQSIIIQPTNFVGRFIMLETRTLCDVELSQPSYTALDLTVVPASIITLTGVSRLFIQFGIYDKITITSKVLGNSIKWLVLGQKVLAL